MINRLRQIVWAARLARVAPDQETVRLLQENRIVAARVANGQIAWHDEGISTDLVHERFFLEGAVHLHPLSEAGARWNRHPDGRLLLNVGGVVLAPSSAEEMLIAAEIFHGGVYNFAFGGPAVVMDIGANVGMASLAFARNPQVRRIYAYEPIPENVERARANLSLNPEFEPKVKLHPYALGADSRMQPLEYQGHLRGSASLRSAPAEIGRLVAPSSNEHRRVTVEVRPATTAVADIRRAHPDCDLWLKVDCEGAEDEIMPSLGSSNTLAQIRGLVMETHCGNGARQEKLLTSAGFTVWRPEPHSRDLGYLLAFRA